MGNKLYFITYLLAGNAREHSKYREFKNQLLRHFLILIIFKICFKIIHNFELIFSKYNERFWIQNLPNETIVNKVKLRKKGPYFECNEK